MTERMQLRAALAASIAAHAATIVAANILTARFGLVPVLPGLLVTAGTYAAGLSLLARDIVHRYGGTRWSLVAIALGGVLSWTLSTPQLAIASVVAFTTAELIDLTIFVPIRRRSFAGAVLASNAVSAPVDTVVFLAIAGFPITWPVVLGQLVGKYLYATAVPVIVATLARRVVKRRAVLRQPVHASGA